MTSPGLPREGRLLEQAREELGISQNEAADRAEMSGTRWRQIVRDQASGMTSTRGVKRLARMSAVVGATPEQWDSIGRADVAARLREQKPEPTAEPTLAEVMARVDELSRELDELRRRTGSD